MYEMWKESKRKMGTGGVKAQEWWEKEGDVKIARGKFILGGGDDYTTKQKKE